MTGLPGQVLEDADRSNVGEAAAYRAAGRFAQILHTGGIDLSEETKIQNYGKAPVERIIEIATPHLDSRTVRWAESIFDGGDPWHGLELVPAHVDFSPRNWLVEPGKRRSALGVIDCLPPGNPRGESMLTIEGWCF